MPDVPTLTNGGGLLLVVVFLIAVVVVALEERPPGSWLPGSWLWRAVEHRYEATRRALTDDPKAQR